MRLNEKGHDFFRLLFRHLHKDTEDKLALVQYDRLTLSNSVGIALGYGMDDRGSRFRFPAGAGNFSLNHSIQNGSEAHPASYPMVPGVISLRVKRPGRETDHSPPFSAEVKECVEQNLHSPNTF
jgi:hypothetical protein